MIKICLDKLYKYSEYMFKNTLSFISVNTANNNLK